MTSLAAAWSRGYCLAVSPAQGDDPCPPAKGERLPVGSHHRRLVPSGFDQGASAALCVLSAAAAALGAVPAGPAAAAPSDDTRAEVDRLYEQAEQATEAFNK